MLGKLVLAFGVFAMVGTGAVAFDARKQASGTNDPALGLVLKLENNLARQALEREPQVESRRANLPQTTGVDALQKEWWQMTGEEELREIAKYNPHVKEYLEIEDARARNAAWARIRRKVGDAGPNGLGDIHTRDVEKPLTREEFDRMSTLDQIKNRSNVAKPSSSGRKKSNAGAGIVWQSKRD